jgi:uncharacterized protein YjbJ (UPF0337 family)
MDKDRIAGGVKKVTGTFKEKVGKALGDAKTAAEGKRERMKGAFKLRLATSRTRSARSPAKSRIRIFRSL